MAIPAPADTFLKQEGFQLAEASFSDCKNIPNQQIIIHLKTTEPHRTTALPTQSVSCSYSPPCQVAVHVLFFCLWIFPQKGLRENRLASTGPESDLLSHRGCQVSQCSPKNPIASSSGFAVESLNVRMPLAMYRHQNWGTSKYNG